MTTPWRQIARPHKDVLKGAFQQSDWAVDLSQIVRKTAPAEYQDPQKFFQRTYITEGMAQLLYSVLLRLNGKGGDPVVQLQTAFGGGKTHTLLAVYHLARYTKDIASLPGLSEVLQRAGVTTLPKARVAIIDGLQMAPAQPMEHDDLKINTLWGELAWQLLGREGYEMVRPSDEARTSPGKEVLVELLQKASPCVILMDEMVAFYRQLGGDNVVAGTFDANMSFLQALTESVKLVPNALLLASLPESDTEAGGQFGIQILKHIETFFARVANVWKPVSAEESFEIVRRRLFEEVTDRDSAELVCREFADYYRENASELPPEVQETTYWERMKKAYPIHPEVFDRLYNEWSTLNNFQRTRGVLQYMALVVNRLWASNDQSPFIMPGDLPLRDSAVRAKSTYYLAPGWDPVMESEIDGEQAEAAKIDASDSRFGGLHAATRAARTIFLGSAPSVNSTGLKGIQRDRILLGSALPGQNISIYRDALSRMRDKMHYLSENAGCYWFDTQPNLLRDMESRKEKVDVADAEKTVKNAITRLLGSSTFFSGLHVFTPSGDIPDEIGSGPRLVVLRPFISAAYSKTNETPAFHVATAILTQRDTQPRSFRNRMIFLAPDESKVTQLLFQAKCCVAWDEIVRDIDEGRLNLDAGRAKQGRNYQASSRRVLDQVIAECYRFVLTPHGEDARKTQFDVQKLGTSLSSLTQTIQNALVSNELVITKWASIHLKRLLEKYYFNGGMESVSVKRVWHDMCKFYYMPRLLDESVFDQALVDGVAEGLYGYATAQDGERYLGLQVRERFNGVAMDEAALLLTERLAEELKQRQTPPAHIVTEENNGYSNDGSDRVNTDNANGVGTVATPSAPSPTKKEPYRRYWGSVELDPIKATGQMSTLISELIANFTMDPHAKVTLKLDIAAELPEGFDDSTVRAINENAPQLNVNGSFAKE